MINGKPVLCVVCGSNHTDSGGKPPRFLTISSNYTRAVYEAGFVPIISAERNAEELSQICDALFLTGGPDLEPSYYGEEIKYPTVKVDPLRAEFEMEIGKIFLSQKKPILTTCRGFQVLNVLLGGDLYQDLPEDLGFIHGDIKLRHYVNAVEGSAIYKLFGECFKTNSTHHQAVRRLGDGLVATAFSTEGIIEAYEHKTLPIIGTQFHPEKLTGIYHEGGTEDFAPLYRYFYEITMDNING